MIMTSRHNGVSFWEIPERKHPFVTDEIILATSSITGAALPESELLAKYLSDEIIRHISDYEYEEYTVDEIITAVRINMRPIIKNPAGEDFKAVKIPERVSVGFLAGVLSNYKILRDGIDRMITNKINGY